MLYVFQKYIAISGFSLIQMHHGFWDGLQSLSKPELDFRSETSSLPSLKNISKEAKYIPFCNQASKLCRLFVIRMLCKTIEIWKI